MGEVPFTMQGLTSHRIFVYMHGLYLQCKAKLSINLQACVKWNHMYFHQCFATYTVSWWQDIVLRSSYTPVTCYSISLSLWTGLILGFRPANERRRYFVTASLIGWAQSKNQPWCRIVLRRYRFRRANKYWLTIFCWECVPGTDHSLDNIPLQYMI